MKHHSIFKCCLGILLALVMSVPAFAQKTYTGTVIDENGEPVIGASIKIVGTTTGTITDFDGKFNLAIPAGKSIEVSFIGYITQKITKFTPNMRIVLKEDTQQLEEVVVVGYGVQKKAHLTGSVESVPMKELQDIPTGNIASALSGMVNGVSVSGGESRPGENATIYVRGANNMSAIGSSAQQPLFVIDGFILDATAFNNLDASSIENISVLKDAAAAVYGARAANGVILVTTKKGKLGAPQISYSGSFGITDAVSTPKMLDTYNYGRLWNAVRAADPTETDLNSRYDLFQADELAAMRSLNYDLLDKYWKTAVTQQHSVNLSGATEKASYFASISYFDQEGNLGKLDYDRWNFRAGVDLKIGKWMKATMQVSGDYGKKNTPLMKVQNSNNDNAYLMLLTHPGYVPEEINGKPMANYGVSNNELNTNQCYNYGYLQNSSDYKRNMTQNTYINGSLEYDFGWSNILKGLKLKLSYSKSISTSKSNEFGTSFNVYRLANRAGSGAHLYTPTDDFDADMLYAESNFLLGHNNAAVSNGTDGGYISRSMNRADKYQLNFTASYARDFGKHSVSALFSIEKSESESEDLYGQGTKPYEFSTGQSNSINSADGGITSSSFGRSESGTLSYVGRINYAYNDRYLLEFLIRTDASTKFAPENYWGTFPSASAGWIISEEEWMKKVKWVDYLKVRASFGLTGRDNIAAWQWMPVYSVAGDKGAIIGTGNPPAGSHLTIPNGNASVNRDVHWDKSYKANFGLDFNTLNNRLAFNIDAYYVWDRDMLLAFSGSVPSTVGTSSASQNYGKMDSYGVELSATWRDRIGKDFKYRVQLQTGLSDNKVLLMDWETGNDMYLKIHKNSRTDMGTWGLQCIGMFRSFQDIEEYFEKYNITSYMGMTKDQVRPGMLIYKDVRSTKKADGTYGGPDGIVSEADDKVQLSHRNNPYHFTTNLSAEYKDFSISAQLNASWGGYSFVDSKSLTPNDGSNSGWKNLEYINMPSFWNPDNMFVYEDIYDASGNLLMAANRNADLPNMRYADVNSKTSTFWRINGTRVTLNRVTLAYKVPNKLVNKLGVQSCRINVTGQNLLSLYNPYPDNYIDPMAGYGSYPTLRKFTIGLNLTF